MASDVYIVGYQSLLAAGSLATTAGGGDDSVRRSADAAPLPPSLTA